MDNNISSVELDSFHVSPPINSLIFTFSGIFMIIVGTFGVFSNVTIFALFFSSPNVRTPFNYLLMNMILAETFIAGFGVPADTVASFQFGWKMGKNFCLATGFILTTAGTVSISTLAILSIHRWMSVRNTSCCKVVTYGKAFAIIISIWVYTLAISVPPFFGFGAFVVETSGITCAPDWESTRHTTYTIYWFLTGFLIPLVTILVTSSLTLYHLKSQRQSSCSETVKKMSEKRERKVSVLILAMNISFLVCWMPYGVICTLYFFGGEGYVAPEIVIVPLLAAKTSVCWNPILYIAMNPQFRQSFKSFYKSPPTQQSPVELERNKKPNQTTSEKDQKMKEPLTQSTMKTLSSSTQHKQRLHKQRMSLKEYPSKAPVKESSFIRRVATSENFEVDKESQTPSKSTIRVKTSSLLRDDDKIVTSLTESSVSDSEIEIQLSENFRAPRVLLPVGPFLNMSRGGTWICLEDFSLYQRILTNDSDILALDKRLLKNVNNIKWALIPTTISDPEIYIRRNNDDV